MDRHGEWQNRLFLSRHLGQGLKALFQLFVRRNGITHRLVEIGGICSHIKVAGARQAEEDRLFLTGFLALERFLNRHVNRMGRFRSRQNSLAAGEADRRLKYLCLLDSARLIQIFVVIKL